MSTEVRLAHPAELPECVSVRHEVFVQGQGVPVELEQDGRDAACVHAIARVDGEAAGTARLRVVDGQAKAERVAVRHRWRGRGLGLALMGVLEQAARQRGHGALHLHAQDAVVAFYEAQGYVAHGAPFVEAGIVHLAMSKTLA